MPKVMKVIRQIWQRYDKDGNGYLNKVEAKHFCEKYYRHSDEGVHFDENESIFNDWFKTLDQDGDG